MNIFVDADACPKAIKEILYRIPERTGIPVTFVANHYLELPLIKDLRFIQVEKGFDVADHKIVQLLQANDLVVTADIPLADEAIKAGALGLNPRGELYTAENIGGVRSTRDFLATMRDGGMELSGPPEFSAKDKQRFANELDRLITRRGFN